MFAGVRQSSALRTLKSMIGKAKEWKVLRERTSFTIPEAPGRDVLIDDAAETAIERELGKSQRARRRATGLSANSYVPVFQSLSDIEVRLICEEQFSHRIVQGNRIAWFHRVRGSMIQGETSGRDSCGLFDLPCAGLIRL